MRFDRNFDRSISMGIQVSRHQSWFIGERGTHLFKRFVVKIKSRSNDDPLQSSRWEAEGVNKEREVGMTRYQSIDQAHIYIYILLMVVKTRYKGQGTSELGGRDGCIFKLIHLYKVRKSKHASTLG